MKEQKEVVSTVNDLIEVCNERILGYRKAAEEVKDIELEALFERYALQTQSFVKELIPFSDQINAEEVGTRFVGDAWRIWMDMKSALTNGGRESMLGAAITGEEAAIRSYENNLEENLPTEVRNIIFRQLGEIKSTYETLKSMKSTS
jgi:uncharacterized protein (TIGR02284 family)